MAANNNFLLIVLVFLLSGLLGFILSLSQHKHYSENVTVIQTFHYPASFVKQLKGDPRAGEKIFKEFCSACHAKKPTIDIHAPRIGDTKFWQNRKAMGMDALLKLTSQGFGAMPARGGCFECSDEQLRQTIQFILENSK